VCDTDTIAVLLWTVSGTLLVGGEFGRGEQSFPVDTTDVTVAVTAGLPVKRLLVHGCADVPGGEDSMVHIGRGEERTSIGTGGEEASPTLPLKAGGIEPSIELNSGKVTEGRVSASTSREKIDSVSGKSISSKYRSLIGLLIIP